MPELSGTQWEPYTGHMANPRVLVITLDGEMLILSQGVQGQKTSYRIDGLEHPFTYRIPEQPVDWTFTGTTRATWEAGRIVVDMLVRYPKSERTVNARRVFSLTADGSLLIETTGGLKGPGNSFIDLTGTTLYRGFPIAVQAPAGQPTPTATPVTKAPPQQTATPVTKAPPQQTATPVTKAPPQRPETLAERQAKINQDVTTKTNSIFANLKETAEAQQAQAAAASQAPAQPPAAQGPPPSASAGPVWEPCGGELRSGASQTVVPVEFVNPSKQPRNLYWFDFAGAKILAGILQPGQRAPMQTYTTHAWMIADGSDQCMGTLVISKAGSIEIR